LKERFDEDMEQVMLWNWPCWTYDQGI
jgi:hypothetical protein